MTLMPPPVVFSPAARPPLHVRLVMAEQRFAHSFAARGRYAQFLYELVRFACKKAWACLFGILMLALMLGSWAWYPRDAALARYDFITLSAIGIQAMLLATRLETVGEARVIAAYHIAGTLMELVKTAQGSWIYPEPSLLRLAGVPLFSGFMYASVGSFMVRTWALFDFRFDRHPPLWALTLLSIVIYSNFMLHFLTGTARLGLVVIAALVLAPCTIHYRVWKVHRRMPLLVAALLTALFIWFAENIGTFAAAWVYPHQRAGWTNVRFSIYLNWFLLLIISYTLVAWHKRGDMRKP